MEARPTGGAVPAGAGGCGNRDRWVWRRSCCAFRSCRPLISEHAGRGHGRRAGRCDLTPGWPASASGPIFSPPVLGDNGCLVVEVGAERGAPVGACRSGCCEGRPPVPAPPPLGQTGGLISNLACRPHAGTQYGRSGGFPRFRGLGPRSIGNCSFHNYPRPVRRGHAASWALTCGQDAYHHGHILADRIDA